MSQQKQKKHIEKNNDLVEQANPLTEFANDVVGKNNSEKMVNQALEKTGIKSETVSDKVELGKDILADKEKSWAGKLTTAALGGLAFLAGNKVLSKKETKNVSEIADKSLSTWHNEDRMKNLIHQI